MSISRQNLSVIIVTFKSEKVIHNCIKSIPKDINIVIVDNSNNRIFKENIEKKYKNTECILSEQNLGMGAGNNMGLKKIKTDYAFIINPDVILEKNTIEEIILASNYINTFGIISPILNLEKYPNFKLDKKKGQTYNPINPFKVKSVDGFAMVLNIKKLNKLKSFENLKYFDENFFMYLENDDLCKRIINQNEDIYVIPTSKINHLGASAVDKKYKLQIELSRNWHWIWSKFYFNKKYYGFLFAFINGLPSFFSACLKFIFYSILNQKKKNIYYHRASGFLCSLIGKKSYLRPKVDS
ncbi:glycosyltransferase [Candidatus Pelagibacter sp.]|nr:glycosyltransferase [Candidatus Pelagibacter sp.]